MNLLLKNGKQKEGMSEVKDYKSKVVLF